MPKAPRYAAGLLYWVDRRSGSGGASEQARRDLPIDADQRIEVNGVWVRHRRDGVIHHKQTDVRDVLANVLRHRVAGVGHLRQEHGPEFAVVEQRLVELGSFLVPGIVHRLQPRRSLEKMCYLKLTWV